MALGCSSKIQTHKIGDIPDIQKPRSVYVDENELFFLDGFTCYVYSLDPFALKYTFGQKGDGPGDFMYKPEIRVRDDMIIGLDFIKTNYFSRNGKFIDVKQYNDFEDFDPGTEMLLLPVKENFVRVLCDHDQRKRSIYWVRSDLKEQKLLYEGPFDWGTDQDIKAFSYKTQVQCYQDMIFVSDNQKGFFIQVFDHQGNPLWTIDKTDEVGEITLSEDEKNKIISKKLETRSEMTFDEVKERIQLYDPVPSISHMIVSDERIHVIMNVKIDDAYKIVVLDLEGNIIDTLHIPIRAMSAGRSVLRFDPYTISQGALYELVKDEDTGVWSVYKIRLY